MRVNPVRTNRLDPFAWLAVLLVVLYAWPAWREPLGDPDLGWLIWAGEQIRHGVLPHINGFSWTAPEFPWVSHEALVALAYAEIGIDHVGLLRGLVVSAAALLVLALCWRRDHGWAGLFALAWTVLLVGYGRTERALSWGNLLLALVVLLSRGGRRWHLPLAAALVGLWASVHGSFVIGIFVLLVADWRWGLVAAAATLANPYGLQVWDLVVGYGLGSDVKGLVHQAVPEWQRVGFDDPQTVLRAVLLLGVGPLLLRRGGWRAAVQWVGLTALALLHRRFFDVAAIALAPHLARVLGGMLPPRPAGNPILPAVAVVAMIALVSPAARLDPARYPADLPSLAGTRLWNDFALGGYLGMRGALVFWDSRNDCYPVDVFADGLAVERQAPGWTEILDRRGVDTVLTAHATLADALATRGWQVTDRPGPLILLRRRSAG